MGGASAGPVVTVMGQIQLHWLELLGLASDDKGAVNNLDKLETGRNHEKAERKQMYRTSQAHLATKETCAA